MKNFKTILGIIAVTSVLFLLSKLPLTEYLNQLTSWFRSFGMWAPILYFLLYTATQSWLFPVFMLSLCAGILFGAFQGFLIASLGNLLSCTAMFLLARYKGRDWFTKKMAKHQKMNNFVNAIEKEGWKMMAMLRAVPIVHMILLNVTCGLSNVKLKEYMFGTWLGMIPMLFVYAYMGSLTDTVVGSPQSFDLSRAQMVGIFGLGIAVLMGFSYYINKVLQKHLVPVKA